MSSKPKSFRASRSARKGAQWRQTLKPDAAPAKDKATPAELDPLVAGKDAYEALYGPIMDDLADRQYVEHEHHAAKKARQHRYATREAPQGQLIANRTYVDATGRQKEMPRMMSPETKARRTGRRA